MAILAPHSRRLAAAISGPVGNASPNPAPNPLRICWLILREARPVVQILYVLRVLVGLRFAGAGHAPTWKAGLALISWISVCVVIYAVNGISDQDGDRMNHSSRPIASGALPAETARRGLAWALLVGLVAAAAVSVALVVDFLLILGVGWWYSFGRRPLKNTCAGLLFSGTALGALSYAAGWLGGGGGAPHSDAVVCCAGLSLWMGLVGTMTKDLTDVSGDRLTGRRTLPIVVGATRARKIAAVVALCYAAAFFVIVLAFASTQVVAGAVVLIGALTVAVACLAKGETTRGNPYRAFIATQYGGNIAVLG